MKQIAKVLGFLAALLPSLALAQTLPANSELGRTVISPGPAQAIPFTTLKSLLGGTTTAAANTVNGKWTGTTTAPIINTIPACANDGTHALVYVNGTGMQCVSITTGGTGTVTSVGYSAGTGLSLSGTSSPITGSGAFSYSLANIAADNLLANSTGSSGPPIATAIGSCSGATKALTYNTSTHAFGCNTTATGTVTSVSVTAGTGITQSGSPVTTTGAITVNVDKAANSDIWGAASNKVLTTDNVFGSAAGLISPTGCGTATVTPSLTAGMNFSCQLVTATNFTLANPTLTSAMVGRQGCIIFSQPASGTVVTIAYNTL